VQLPGVQDPVRAREIMGRTATLEVRLVDEEATASGSTLGVDVFPERRQGGSIPVAVKKQVIVTGDQFIGAAATFDQDHRAAVSVELDQSGGRIMREVTRENLKKRMAIILFERGKGGASSAAGFRSPATSAPRRPTTCRSSSAPARSPRRCRSSRSAPWARASARTTSTRASTRRRSASSPS
jgi:preprotein translocase subunit SecD